MSELYSTVSHLTSAISQMKKKVDDLENRSRCNNLIVYGIPEDPRENPAQLRQKVCTDVFYGMLDVTVTSIERIHRRGYSRGTKPQPVLPNLRDFNEKTSIFKNARKLKNTGISVSDYYSKPVQLLRKKLWDRAAQNREHGDKVTVVCIIK